MPPTALLLPIFLVLPGFAFARGRRCWTVAEMFFLSLAITGWTAQTLALAERFTLPWLTASLLAASMILLLRRPGCDEAVAGTLRRSVPGLIALGIALVPALLIYRPPGVALIGFCRAPSFHNLGLFLARHGSLPTPRAIDGLAGAAEALHGAAGPGLVHPALTGLMQLLGGEAWASWTTAAVAWFSLAAVFLLGRRLTGANWFGALFLFSLALNYPQVWLARTALPESAAQLLVLCSTLFFLRGDDRGPGTAASAFCLGTAILTAPGLLPVVPAALLLLLALHAGAEQADRRRAARFTLLVMPFLVQGWMQSVILGRPGGVLPPTAFLLPAAAAAFAAVAAILPLPDRFRRFLPLVTRVLFVSVCGAWHGTFLAAVPRFAGGTSHWVTWYVTLPFLVLCIGGLLFGSARPSRAAALARSLGPLLPLALLTALRLFHNPGSDGLQPWSARPFSVAVIPAVLLIALLFHRAVYRRLAHPAPRIAWGACLAVMLGLNLANLMPMATARPGLGDADLVRRVAETLGDRSWGTVVVESGPGVRGLHLALEGGRGIRSAALTGRPGDREHFHRLVRENDNAGRPTALVVQEGVFTPDPSLVRLDLLGTITGEARLLPPARDHLPSSASLETCRLLIFRVSTGNGMPRPGPPAVDVGDYRQDWPLLADGFHETTQTEHGGFRWTGEQAGLRLPGGSGAVTLTVGGFRPPGAPEAVLAASFSGDAAPPFTSRLPRRGFITITLPRPPGTAPLLRLRSTVFRPAPWLTGKGTRVLGFQLAGALVHPCPADQAEPPVNP